MTDQKFEPTFFTIHHQFRTDFDGELNAVTMMVEVLNQLEMSYGSNWTRND